VAERFELYVNGVEIGNGYQELTGFKDNQARIEADCQRRQHAGLQNVVVDALFLTAMDQLPKCAGVSLGFDRLMLALTGSSQLTDVLAFPIDVA